MSGHDHDHAPEPIPGLPTRLPEGEEILWQGAPTIGSFARRVFHLRKVAAYFAIVLAATLGLDLAAGTDPVAAAGNAGSLLLVALLPIGMLWLIGRAMARGTVYTITSQRVVLRFGLALPITVQVPFSQVHGADARTWDDGTGDITLQLVSGTRGMNYLVMWPHVRPWTWFQPQPALRSVPDAERIAGLLATAWSDATGVARQQRRAAPAARPAPARGGLEPAAH